MNGGDRIDWAAAAARVRPPVGHPERVAAVAGHVVIACGRTGACTCGDQCERRSPVAAARWLEDHAGTHAPWRRNRP